LQTHINKKDYGTAIIENNRIVLQQRSCVVNGLPGACDFEPLLDKINWKSNLNTGVLYV
jgi:hypothetical protein